jgi:hypothetical protein
MKKTVIIILLMVLSTKLSAQEDTKTISEKKTFFMLKSKIGFSELKINNKTDGYTNVNGNVTGFELALSSKLSNKFRLEYGVGLSEFKANFINENEFINIKNQYIQVPVNLMYNHEINSNGSIIIGVGMYGNYLGKSDMGTVFKGNNVGINFGYNIQLGANLKLSDSMDFRIMLEGLSDLSDIDKNQMIKVKQVNTALLSLNFIYKL